MYKKRIITSEDGSHTIELIGQNEQYHSTFGAVQESSHVYIKHGLERIAEHKKQINILEVGMGTGLNVLLTYQYAMEHQLDIHYTAVEAYPLEKEIWEQLNYAELINKDFLNIYETIHQSKWNEECLLKRNFTLDKINRPIQNTILNENTFDLVYFDAFNPDLEPELWSEKVFSKIYVSMRSNSVLSTYSTKGIIKRALKSCGFKIEKKPGPIGKREILNALKL
jgi:tRNA U34 5-methylaminomethyl-2-thiouridine-forming methyltransferase MnmC